MAKNRELLFTLTKKDFKVQTFRAGGKGGQHQNKTDSAVRIIHPDSGAVGESRKHRSQHQNKKVAFEHLVAHVKFRVWHAAKCQEIFRGQSIEEKVKKDMTPENIKVEILEEGEWVIHNG